MKIVDGATPGVRTMLRWIKCRTPLTVKLGNGDVFICIMTAATGEYFDCDDTDGNTGPSFLWEEVEEIGEEKG